MRHSGAVRQLSRNRDFPEIMANLPIHWTSAAWSAPGWLTPWLQRLRRQQLRQAVDDLLRRRRRVRRLPARRLAGLRLRVHRGPFRPARPARTSAPRSARSRARHKPVGYADLTQNVGQLPRQAAGASGAPPRPLRAPALTAPATPHRGAAARGAGADGLLLYRPAVRHQAIDPAVHRDRRGLGLRLGAAARLRAQPPRAPLPGAVSPPRARGRPGRLADGGDLHRQRLRVSARANSVKRSSGSVLATVHPRRPAQLSNRHVERLQLTILEECWRPSFARSLAPKLTALEGDLSEYLAYADRAHTGRLTRRRLRPNSSHVRQRWGRPTKPSRQPRVSAP
jgi:hypothetical protein